MKKYFWLLTLLLLGFAIDSNPLLAQPKKEGGKKADGKKAPANQAVKSKSPVLKKAVNRSSSKASKKEPAIQPYVSKNAWSSNGPNPLIEQGIAGWYGHFHHGRKTASGERFSRDLMTAAHRTMPFNTLLKVTDTVSGQSVVVRVTDRGPYVRNRIIDLSEEAATQLGIRYKGVSRVSIEKMKESSAENLPDGGLPFENASVRSIPDINVSTHKNSERMGVSDSKLE